MMLFFENYWRDDSFLLWNKSISDHIYIQSEMESCNYWHTLQGYTVLNPFHNEMQHCLQSLEEAIIL